MPASSSAFGTYAPAAIDPFPIESVLAKIVGENNPDNAANLLDLYQVQRGTSEGNYNYAMQQQHDFARQQLAQQLKEKYLQYGQEALKTPGGISLFRSQAGQDALGPDFGPDQISTIETNLGNAQLAGTAEKAGSAAWHGVQAGFPPNLGRLSSLSGGLFDTQGTPLSTANIALKESLRGGGGAGGTAGVPSFSAQLPADPAHPDVTWNMSVPPRSRLTPGQALDYAQRSGIYKPRVITPLPDQTPAGATPAPKGSPTSPPAPNNTSLQNNPNNRAPVSTSVQGNMAVRDQVERNVENKIRLSNPAAYNDIVAGKVGGKVNIVGTTPDGRPIIQGKTGRYQ